MKPLELINSLIPYLPQKDISIAQNLIAKRDFEELSLLVKSVLAKIRRNKKSSNPNEEYLKLDREMIKELDINITNYLDFLDISQFTHEYGDEQESIPYDGLEDEDEGVWNDGDEWDNEELW